MICTVYSLLKENKRLANFSEKRNMKIHVDSTSNDMQSATERWKKALLNLQNHLQDFKDDLARTENMFEETKEDIEAQSRADRNCQFLKKDSARQHRTLKKVAEVEKLVNSKRLHENTASQYWRKTNANTEGSQNTLSQGIARLLKIGAVALLETVAAYTLFRISKPFFF